MPALPLLEGVVPPMLTPVTGRDGDVDVPALREYVRFLVDGGVHGLFPCGSTGEFTSLTREQRATVVRTVIAESGDLPVLAGCGDTSVGGVLSHVEAAADAGADAAVVVTPYYLATSQAGLRAFYERVADESRLPVVLYTIPAFTNHDVSVETARRLAAHDNVVGLKDSTGDLLHLRDVVAGTPPSFRVLQGSSNLAVPGLGLGADGVTPTVANVFPGAAVELYDAHRDGDRERVAELENEAIYPLMSASDSLPTAAAFKHLAGRAGQDVGPPLLPLPRVTDRQRERLDDAYEAARTHV